MFHNKDLQKYEPIKGRCGQWTTPCKSGTCSAFDDPQLNSALRKTKIVFEGEMDVLWTREAKEREEREKKEKAGGERRIPL